MRRMTKASLALLRPGFPAQRPVTSKTLNGTASSTGRRSTGEESNEGQGRQARRRRRVAMRWPFQATAESPRPSGLSVEMTARFRGRSQREARGNFSRACLGGTGQVWAPAQPGKASSRRSTGSRRGARRTRIATARFRDDRPSASPTTPKARCRRPGGASPDRSASTRRTFLPISPGIHASSTTRCRTRSCGPGSGSHTT